jgi:hypothetical protein
VQRLVRLSTRYTHASAPLSSAAADKWVLSSHCCMHEMRAHLQAKRQGPTLTHGVENPLDTLGRGRLLQCQNAQRGAAQSFPQWNPAVKPAGGERPATHDIQGTKSAVERIVHSRTLPDNNRHKPQYIGSTTTST